MLGIFPKDNFSSDNFPSENFPMCNFPSGNFPNAMRGGGRTLRLLELIWEVAAWEIAHLESCRLGNCIFGKLPLWKIHLESCRLGKCHHKKEWKRLVFHCLLVLSVPLIVRCLKMIVKNYMYSSVNTLFGLQHKFFKLKVQVRVYTYLIIYLWRLP